MKVDSLTSSHVSEFINRDDGVSLSQRRFRLSAINSYTSLAKALGEAKGNVSYKLRVNMKKLSHKQKERKHKEPFTRDEYDSIMVNCWRVPKFSFGNKYIENRAFFKTATALSYWTGLRLCDCASLEWDAVITEPDHLVVWTKKAGDSEHARVALPLENPLVGSGELREVLNELPFESPQYVFPHHHKIITTIRTRSYLPQAYRRFLKQKDMFGESFSKTFHCLRHSFVTRMSEAGVGIEDIGKLVAHADTTTTDIYNHA
tara:strand:- start:599 stop:1378 length:780 start_codon:yes stop_codon:yes gene_type:complete